MKIRKTHLSWALRLWILASVFVIPFLSYGEVALWVLAAGALALAWHRLPEEPEEPVEPLPYAHLYRGREIPRHGDPPPSDPGEKPL